MPRILRRPLASPFDPGGASHCNPDTAAPAKVPAPRDDGSVIGWWLGDVLWSLWAAASTVASVAFLLAAGAAIFGLFVGAPYSLARYRQSRDVDRAMAELPAAVRDEVAELEMQLGPFDEAGAFLAAAPVLRPRLSGYGVPAELLLDRILRQIPGPEGAPEVD